MGLVASGGAPGCPSGKAPPRPGVTDGTPLAESLAARPGVRPGHQLVVYLRQ